MLKTRLSKLLVGAGVALAVAVALFDSSWFRGPLERHLSATSGREVRIGGLLVQPGLQTTVHLRNLYIQNTSWADDRPMTVAGELSFTFSVRSLWDERIVVSRVVLVDAEVDLESQADGLRNWRLTDPDDRGPPKVRVLAVEARNATLRFVNRGMELELTTAASALAADDAARTDKRQMATRVDFHGSYRGAKFSGTALTGDHVTLQKTGRTVPLLGYMQTGRTRFDVDGVVADLMDLSVVDAQVRLAGPSLAGLHPFLHFRPPDTRPYLIKTQLRLSGGEYAFAGLGGKVGETDIAGDGSYRRDSPDRRGMLRADLRSNSADLADFGSTPGTGARSIEAGRVLPAGKFDIERLKAIDARVNLDIKKLRARGALALQSLRFTSVLDDGVLQVKPLDFGIAGGHAAGLITADARGSSVSSRAMLDFRDVRLESMFPDTAAKTHSAGPVSAHLELSGQGDSIATLLGNASGTVEATLARGRISNLADAKMALNGGKILALKFRGDRDIDISCGTIAVDFRNGSGRSRTMLLDTEQTRTEGSGTVDLRNETFDALLTPRPKKPGFLALKASIRVRGTFRHAEVSIDKQAIEEPARGDGACAANLRASR